MDNNGFPIFVGVLLLLVSVAFAVHNTTDNAWERDMIERGYVVYCPADGEFAFKGECEEEG